MIINFLKMLIKFIFFPVRLLSNLIYGVQPLYAAHSLYTKENYDKMVKHAKDDEDKLLMSYKEWKLKTEQTVEGMRRMGIVVIMVNVDYDKMARWLKKNKLENIMTNREAYISYRFEKFMKNPVIE